MIADTLLHLSLIEGIGPVATKQLVEQVLQAGVDLYTATVTDLRFLGIPEGIAQKVVEGLQNQALLDREYALIEKHRINWTTLADETYPALLWHTHAPSPVLYWQGEVVWNNAPVLAVVGSREGTQYGKRALDSIVAPCVEKGMMLVSGGARGIDAMAHELTLNQGGATVVILGSGLLRPYPASNKDLFKRVLDEGSAMMSCFPLEAEGIGWRFPVRNRIIAGMARGCLVVQAAEGSGALITARFALDEGRNVYAVPGHFDDPLSLGCHQLLSDGAQLVTQAQDILRDYPTLAAITDEQTSLIAPKRLESVRKQATPEKVLSPEEGTIAFCARAISFEELRERTGKAEHELKAELFELQLAGKVVQDFAGLWSKC